MPVGVVKTKRDEHLWAKAKSIAAKQGRKEDYAYIMGIYKKMTGKSMNEPMDLKKSGDNNLARTPRFVIGSIPGQVPSHENLKLMAEAKEQAPVWSMARLMAHNGSYLSPQSVVEGIGLDSAAQNSWANYLGESDKGNELVFRQKILSKMLNERMDQATRQALFQRSMGYYRDMRKSLVQVAKPDELKKSFDPQDRLEKAITRRARKAGPKGYRLTGLRDLVQGYGKKRVAEVLKKSCAIGGSLAYENGVILCK